MKQEGSARRRGADKAKPPPGGGEQEPPPPPAPQDVEMKEEAAAGGGSTGEADGKTAATAAEHSQRELDTVTLEDIKEHVKQLEKAVSGKEPRFVLRALRMLPSTSRRLNHYVLYKAVHGFFTSNNATRDFLLPFLEEGTILLHCRVILPSQEKELGIRTPPAVLISHYPSTQTLCSSFVVSPLA
ncbi:26S proteasome non-ATPase regulatory subunit 3 [Camelus dromedarius]|uniref:26S proteasome non-ATPase regulatory subunit 3 n=1 Tax=Camelus dromedarius TaxID=9838 RepID=A0A5N4D1W2_CAMDR|nr:26S proteasome non-ATPase regulatory subunit 3 [Camelus dromedarius]